MGNRDFVDANTAEKDTSDPDGKGVVRQNVIKKDR
jgi:hypothetical protein